MAWVAKRKVAWVAKKKVAWVEWEAKQKVAWVEWEAKQKEAWEANAKELLELEVKALEWEEEEKATKDLLEASKEKEVLLLAKIRNPIQLRTMATETRRESNSTLVTWITVCEAQCVLSVFRAQLLHPLLTYFVKHFPFENSNG